MLVATAVAEFAFYYSGFKRQVAIKQHTMSPCAWLELNCNCLFFHSRIIQAFTYLVNPKNNPTVCRVIVIYASGTPGFIVKFSTKTPLGGKLHHHPRRKEHGLAVVNESRFSFPVFVRAR